MWLIGDTCDIKSVVLGGVCGGSAGTIGGPGVVLCLRRTAVDVTVRGRYVAVQMC